MLLAPPSPASAPRARWVAGVALVASLLLAFPTPARAQDFTTTTTTTVPTTVAETVDDPVDETETQTLVEAEPQEDRFLTTESRRIVAAIGGLVVVALMLALLTVRYWRQTKPVAPEEAPVGGADHADVDESWEPLATGEHAVFDLPDRGPRPRPSTEARRKVLGRT